MKNIRLLTAACISLVLYTTAAADSNELIRMEQEAIRSAASSVAAFVVQVETLGGLERVGRMLIGTGPTTGLIVSEDGYIISSAFNFIQQPSSILVTLPDGQRRPATIVARDRSRMLVLLKVKVDQPLPVPAAAARSELRVGQTVVAIGKTFDSEQVNLSVGIIRALHRIWGKAIQTDANISPANYGGPLIDLYGRVVGVLVPLSPQSDEEVAGAEWYDSGIGFAVPLEDIHRQLDRLKTGQDLLPGKLGIAFEDADQLDPETKIAVVKLNSPAAQAGLQPGDRILAMNGQPVERHSQVRHQLGPLYAGDPVQLTISRDGQTLELKSILTDTIPPYEHAFLGILPARSEQPSGVVVRFVYADSPAANAGLLVDDRLTQIDDHVIENAAQLRTKLATYQPDQLARLSWQRGSEQLTGEIVLGRLPESVPEQLPELPMTPVVGALQTGQVPIEIPEDPNRCTAFVPESLNRGHQGGLLVVLLDPGEIKVDDVVERWKAVCEAHDLVLLVPEPSDSSRWQPTEVGYIRKVIDQAINRFALHDQRIAVFGESAGGAMAYLVGFRNRDVVRGIAAINAPPPSRLVGIDNEPLQRLAILASVTDSSPLKERVETGIRTLRELKFPVTKLIRNEADRPLTEDERSEVGRWVDSLDRL